MIIITIMKSKENNLLELLFNSTKYWHFEDLRLKAKIGRPQLARWLKIFQKEGLIKRVKPAGKMPYYIQDSTNKKWFHRKKLFALQKLTNSGFFDHLSSLSDAKVVILFGSFARADWDTESDIDIFIYGTADNFEQGKYELKLKREIQVHQAQTREEIQKIDKLLPYIISGEFIKGSIQDLGVQIHAKN